MSDADQITKLVDAVERDFGQTIGVLIANAGRGIRASLLDLTLEEFDKTHAVNIRAPFLIAKLAVPKMVAEKFGRIVFVGSVAGFTGGVVGPHYASSKSALHGLSHSIASNFAAHGITSNVVAPALIEDTTMLPGDPGDLAKRIPVGRLGKPDEVAGIVSMMVTTGYLTNQTVLVDGGLYPT